MRTRAAQLLPLALVFPSMAFLAVLVLVPLAHTLLLSVVTETGGFTLETFRQLLADVDFSEALRNTLLLVVLVVPLQVALALVLALLIHSRFRDYSLFRYVSMLPLAVSELAAGFLWLAVFTERGFLNSALRGVGVTDRPVLWLSFDNFAGLLTAIVIAESWRTTAVVLVVLLAGLQLIPRDLLETAELLGASRFRRAMDVVLPLLRPSLWSALILRTILALPIFAVVLVLAGRNVPVLAGETYTSYVTNGNEHVAAAYAAVIVGISILAMAVYLRVVGLREAEVHR